ncbi:MAG TPA: cytochrome c biogenesis protein CcsA [Salinivirgaceae bacterium]|nr:cytochrome c biogenesis protein CcsA [Salinivirgaceae bacterium]
MIWNYFVPVSLTVILLWLASIYFIHSESTKSKHILWYSSITASALLGLFIILYWFDIKRPPMQTMAETRLWYSFLVSLVSLTVFKAYRSKSMVTIGLIMASVFLIVDIIHPEYQGRFMMPALQSPWFIPHVVSYMLAYAILASASISAAWSSFSKDSIHTEIHHQMRLIYPGFALLTLGMLLGAYWAKFAWGDYWAWDPKEVWALITWLFYLLIIHIHRYLPAQRTLLARLMIVALGVLLITWLGIKYLPSASQSIHVYGD